MMRFWNRCTVTVLSACLAVTALPAKDLVLCIGAHGHVALEFAQNGRCAEGPCRAVGDAPQAPGVNSHDRPCGDCLSCVDIPLAQGPVAGPSFAFNGAKKKSASQEFSSPSAVHPVRLALNPLGTVHCASLPPPGGGVSCCVPPRVLRI